MPLPDDPRTEAIRKRQRSRAIATAIALFALVALFYFISIAKMM
jgi:hypothetical protein